MKKELTDLIALSDNDKTLTLNGAFRLKARFLDELGRNVKLYKTTPVSVAVDLVCTMQHDKFFLRSMPIEARDAAAMQTEIAGKMASMFANFGRELEAQMMSGYLP